MGFSNGKVKLALPKHKTDVCSSCGKQLATFSLSVCKKENGEQLICFYCCQKCENVIRQSGCGALGCTLRRKD